MSNEFKDKINKIYADAIKAMEEGKSKKYIRLSLLECAASLEEYARMFPLEKSKSNNLGFKLLNCAKEIGAGEPVENVYFKLTGKKLAEEIAKMTNTTVKKVEEKKEETPLDDFESWLKEMKEGKKEEEVQKNKAETFQVEKPNEEQVEENGTEVNENLENEKPQRKVEREVIDDDNVGSFKKTNNKLRIQTLDDYVGQEQIKPLLREALMAAKKRGEPLEHILMFGSAGLGKTTLAKIIANEMSGNCIVMSGPTIKDAESFVDVIKKVKKGDVVFIDEIHRIPKAAAESIYTAMEDFELSYLDRRRGEEARNVTLSLPAFTLIGATTHSGLLTKPMRDRFALQFKLEPYTRDELARLATASMRRLGYILDFEGAKAIAKRSRGVPRICNGFVKRIRDKAQLMGAAIVGKDIVDSYFTQCGIDENGLEDIDLDYLKTIVFKFDGGPVGIDILSAALGEGRNIIENQIEPYLIFLGLINISSGGREITSRGRKYITGDTKVEKANESVQENNTEEVENLQEEKEEREENNLELSQNEEIKIPRSEEISQSEEEADTPQD